ncbi:hypothetical protein IFM89_000762 [Coptis chinensis]|uniref:Uncharacterized protein n=1 Tax=Coptis chinensis TaxID=261450 RepID=A0A835M870_9MAGN|nr:hypothetical protein IFM89_000762 [Coptis chinensis]
MILLRKMDQCLQISDHGLFGKIASTHKESGGSHVEHNIRLKDPPCKKNKDHKYGRIKHALEKKKRTAKAQRNSRNGRRGLNTERNKDVMADDGLHEVVVHKESIAHTTQATTQATLQAEMDTFQFDHGFLGLLTQPSMGTQALQGSHHEDTVDFV